MDNCPTSTPESWLKFTRLRLYSLSVVPISWMDASQLFLKSLLHSGTHSIDRSALFTTLHRLGTRQI